MKHIHILICAVIFSLDSVQSYNKNVDGANTTTQKIDCAKVYYAGEDFYKIYCFHHMPSYNNSLGIITDRNDTVTFKGYENHAQCFNVYHSETNSQTSVCVRLGVGNCEETKEKVPVINTLDEIPCKEDTQWLVLRLTANKLNIVFRCKIYYEEVPVESSSDQKLRVKYCHITPVEADSEEGREDVEPDYDYEGLIFDIPMRQPKRE